MKSINIGVAALVSAVIALPISFGISVLACRLGFLFSGLDQVLAVLGATGFCAIAAPVTAVVVKRLKRG